METLQSSGVVEYETVDEGYFEQRQLKRGAAGWMLLVGLGVAYVISGDFAGWNFGLNSERPYRAPGGVITSGIALVLACSAAIAGFLVDPRVIVETAVVYEFFVVYFAFYSRNHLVAAAPGEDRQIY